MFESSISQATTLRCKPKSFASDSPQLSDGVFQNESPPRDDMVEATRKWFRGAPNREPAEVVSTTRRELKDFSAAENDLGVTWLGHSTVLLEIGRRLGPFDLTMMEIGAYDSAWADVHMGPEQAVAAHHLVGGRLMLPIHWATFNLALHGWTEPGERALAEARRTDTEIVTPRPGERLTMSNLPQPSRWWPSLPWRSARLAPIVSSKPVPSSELPAPSGTGS